MKDVGLQCRLPTEMATPNWTPITSGDYQMEGQMILSGWLLCVLTVTAECIMEPIV